MKRLLFTLLWVSALFTCFAFQCKRNCGGADILIGAQSVWYNNAADNPIIFYNENNEPIEFNATYVDSFTNAMNDCDEMVREQFKATIIKMANGTDEIHLLLSGSNYLSLKAYKGPQIEVNKGGIMNRIARKEMNVIASMTFNNRSFDDVLFINSNEPTTSSFEYIALAKNQGIVAFKYQGVVYAK